MGEDYHEKKKVLDRACQRTSRTKEVHQRNSDK